MVEDYIEISVLDGMTAEEMAFLDTLPEFQKFMNILHKERDSVRDMIAVGAGILSNDPYATSIQYATNVGRVSVLSEIVDYKPKNERED